MDDDLKKSILKTGTTILGIVCKDGIVMASDRQITAGSSLVVGKNFFINGNATYKKIYFSNENVIIYVPISNDKIPPAVPVEKINSLDFLELEGRITIKEVCKVSKDLSSMSSEIIEY